MGRPRKNRVAEYANLLVEEIAFHLGKEIARSAAETHAEIREELTVLHLELRNVKRQLDALERRSRDAKPRARIGRWVPGGPGRPPKDASARIAAFSARARTSPSRKRQGARGHGGHGPAR